MPKVCLTAEDRYNAVCEKRDLKLQALILAKMREYNIPMATIEKTLKVAKNGAYYRLKKPTERLNINELAALLGVLRVSIEELCNLMRG